MAGKQIGCRIEESLLDAFDLSASRRGLTRTEAVEALIVHRLELDAAEDAAGIVNLGLPSN